MGHCPVYRVYRHEKPITVKNLGEAELVTEVPEAVSCWNLLAVRNTEHPNQGTPTKRSVLRPGKNLALNHVMERYRIQNGAEPIPRGTGLAVLTATKARRAYYAVTIAVKGREGVRALDAGSSLRTPVEERPSTFPAIVYQYSNRNEAGNARVLSVDAYTSWLGDPYHNVPIISDTFVVRWRDRSLRADAFVTFTLGPEGSVESAKMRAFSPDTDFSYDFHDLHLIRQTDR